jgi:hypothetical protein
MRTAKNYEIILNEAQFRGFVEWLPELEPGEVFYGCLFARKKYDDTGVVKNDKGQLKRFTSTKQYLYQKVRQLECEIGAYQSGGVAVPENALALYVMPNPRSLIRATQKTLVELSRILIQPSGSRKNPHKVALSEIQKTASRKVYLEFDFDGDAVFEWENFEGIVNPEAITVLDTRGGFHVLVELAKVAPEFKKSWYNKMVAAGCDVRGDNLMPVPGCIQGGFIPSLWDVSLT